MFAVGGPFLELGRVTAPLPLTTLGAAYGLTDTLDVQANLHPSAAVLGVLGLDLGATWLVFAEQGLRPALSLSGQVYGFTDFKAVRPYFEVSAAGSYLFATRFLTFLSTGLFIQTLAAPIWWVGLGEEFRLGRTGVAIELRWYQPSRDTRWSAANWKGIGDLGALGLLLSVNRTFAVGSDHE
jgi:hypothetical protein